VVLGDLCSDGEGLTADCFYLQRSQMMAAWLNDTEGAKAYGALSLAITTSIEHENWRMYHEINTGYIRDHFHESKFLVWITPPHLIIPHLVYPTKHAFTSPFSWCLMISCMVYAAQFWQCQVAAGSSRIHKCSQTF
jgi:hypothetical protein